MHFTLSAGVPSLNAYRQLLGTTDFAQMAAFSDAFLARHHAVLGYYRLRWGVDPLRTWSRQWEYPFVYQEVQAAQAASGGGPLKVLDAGSGVTFLPWLLQQHLQAEMHCCDSDPQLESIYQQLNAAASKPVQFQVADLRRLPYADHSMDVIYCISVLEHTQEYPQIVKEFARLLKPGGRLIVTFDVSLDGLHDISVPQGQLLLEELSRTLVASGVHQLEPQLSGNALTTRACETFDPKLLPWKFPILSRVKASLRKKRWVSWPPQLAVYCLTLHKSTS
jgi:SAM-dependent methyltransferase